ncbi:hypothetical protein BSKO_08605 [Bryopsis sp. KO-2023]|nr:hypothetical protein BSKO_08605 [Bryopsis sp. KO-2023]
MESTCGDDVGKAKVDKSKAAPLQASAQKAYGSKLSRLKQQSRDLAEYNLDGATGLKSVLKEVEQLKQGALGEETLLQETLKQKERAIEEEIAALSAQMSKPSFVLKTKTLMTRRLVRTDEACEVAIASRNSKKIKSLAAKLGEVEAARGTSQATIDQEMKAQVVRITNHQIELAITNTGIAEAQEHLQACHKQRVQHEAQTLDFFRRATSSSRDQDTHHAELICNSNKHVSSGGAAREGYIEKAPLFLSPDDEIELIEIVPHTKRLMALQDISNKFTSLGGVAANLNRVLQCNSMMSDLHPHRALETAVNIAKSVMKARAVYVYIVRSGKMKCIAPDSAVTSPIPVGRGLAGYTAQTGSTVCVEDQHKHPSFDTEQDHQIMGSAPTPVVCIAMKCPSMGASGNADVGKVVMKAVGKEDGEERFDHDDHFFMKAICSTISKSIGSAEVYESARSHDLLHKKLIEMVQTLTSELDTVKLMHTIADAAVKLVEAEMCVMYQMDRRTGELVAYCSGRRKRFRRAATGLVGSAFLRGANMNLPDVRKHNLFEATIDQLPNVKPRSIILVTVLSQLGAPIGLLQAVNKIRSAAEPLSPAYVDDSAFTDRDEEILTSLANQVAITLENCQRFSQRMEKNIDVRNVVIQRTTSEAVRDIAGELRDKLNCESSKVFIVNEERNQLTLHAPNPKDHVHFSMSKGIAGHVATTGKVLNVREARAEPLFDQRVDGHGLQVSTVACVPVVDSSTGKIVAVLENVNKRRAYFDREDEELCEKSAVGASILLSNARLHDESLETDRRMQSFTKHMKFLADARLNPLRFYQAIEDLCTHVFRAICSTFLQVNQEGALMAENTLGGKELGLAKDIQLATDALAAGNLLEPPLPELQEDSFSGETIKPCHTVYVPAFAGGSTGDQIPVGVLCVQRKSIDAFQSPEKRMLGIVAQSVASMVNKRKALVG